MPSPPAEPKSVKLGLKAVELCWIQVIIDDDSPRQLTLKPGDTIEYKADEMIRLLVGNAGGLEITYNGHLLESMGRSGQPVRLAFPPINGED